MQKQPFFQKKLPNRKQEVRTQQEQKCKDLNVTGNAAFYATITFNIPKENTKKK